MSLFEEIRRRRVFQVAAVYAVVSWLVIQIADVILPTFDAPQWINQTLIILLALGFPLVLVLAWALNFPPHGVSLEPGAGAGPVVAQGNQGWNAIVLGLLVLAMAFLFVDRYWLDGVPSAQFTVADESRRVTRSSINLGYLAQWGPLNFRSTAAITPDGASLVYNGYSSGGRKIYVRDLASFESRLLYDNPGNLTLSFSDQAISPDGSQVALRRVGQTLLISLEDGTAREAPRSEEFNSGRTYGGRGFDWLGNDALIYPTTPGKLAIQSLADGTRSEIDVPGAERDQLSNPQVLPGDRHVLYAAAPADVRLNSRIEILDLDTLETVRLLQNGFYPRYAASGHILFARDGSLRAVPFDLASMMLTGPDVVVLENLEVVTGSWGGANYAVSESGRLIYSEGGDIFTRQARSFVLRSRDGSDTPLDIAPTGWQRASLSPRGDKVMLLAEGSGGGRIGEVYIYHVDSGITDRRTFAPVLTPIWYPDGESFVYVDQQDSRFSLYRMPVSGLGQAELFYSSPSRIEPFAFTPDSSELLFTSGAQGREDLNSVALSEDAPAPRALVTDPNSNDTDISISPDGRWIAYIASGGKIFVRPYPNIDDGVFEIVSDNGFFPLWGPGSDEIFYHDEQTLYRLPVSTGDGFQWGQPEAMFTDVAGRGSAFRYGMSADAQTFLIPLETEESDVIGTPQFSSLNLVDNWFEELQRLAPSK